MSNIDVLIARLSVAMAQLDLLHAAFENAPGTDGMFREFKSMNLPLNRKYHADLAKLRERLRADPSSAHTVESAEEFLALVNKNNREDALMAKRIGLSI